MHSRKDWRPYHLKSVAPQVNIGDNLVFNPKVQLPGPTLTMHLPADTPKVDQCYLLEAFEERSRNQLSRRSKNGTYRDHK